MKVAFIKLISSIFITALLMTSCLGDSDNSYQIDRTFAYVTNVDGVKVACTDIGYVNSAVGMENMMDGQCYFVGFKITNTNSSTGIYSAEYMNVLDNGAIDQSRLSDGKPYYNIDPITQNDSIQIASMRLAAYYPAKELYNDRWLFSFSIPNMYEDDEVDAYFYYDPTNQVNEKGETIGISDNKIVIDVRFIKKEGSGAGTSRTKEYFYVGNLSSMRSYEPKYNDKGTAGVAVKFRYVIPRSGETPPTIKYFPTGDIAWDGDSNNAYILYYNKN